VSWLFDVYYLFVFFFSSRRRHTRFSRDWSSDVCSSDLNLSCASICFLISSCANEIASSISASEISFISPSTITIEVLVAPTIMRSEERRVGKEGRSRWSPYHER